MQLSRNFLIVVALLVLTGQRSGLLAADGAALRLTASSVGFGGKFKAGFCQPAKLRLVAGAADVAGDLEIVAADGDQVPAAFRNPARCHVALAAGEERELVLYFKSGPIGSPVLVRLVSDDRVVWSQPLAMTGPALPSTAEFIVSLGAAIGIEEALAVTRLRTHAATQAVNVRDVESLPDQWRGYDGVDLLVLNTSDAGFWERLAGDRLTAIVNWVRLGGRLLIGCGAAGERVFAEGSALAPLMPGELQEVDPLRDRSGLENFTKAELPFADAEFQRNRPLVTRLKNLRGETLVEEVSSSVGRPLVVRAPAGLGQVTFVALDLDHPALATWKGKTRFLAPLLARASAARESGDQEPHRGVTHLGYEDLIGQLRSALDHFGEVSAVSFTTVSMLIAGYLLLIGPGDFLFLSRMGLPRHWTWFTFPALAVGAAVTANVVERQSHGSRMRLHQAEVIDIDLGQQVVRGTLWSNVFSAQTRGVSLSLNVLPPDGVETQSIEAVLTWQGLPGDALGGLESQQPSLVSREAYRVVAPAWSPQIRNLIIPASSAKSLGGVWSAECALEKQEKLVLDRYGLLAGEFTHPLSVPLSDCLLAHGEKMYRLGTLAPGQRVQLAELQPLNLEARLTQIKVDQSKDVVTPWERDSIDVPRIMQMVMFHEAARGRSYTGLTHRYQSQLDLSEHIRFGQAVLVGRAEQPVARLMDRTALESHRPTDVNTAMNSTTDSLVAPDDAQTYSWYRVVFPVRPKPVASPTP